MKFMSKNSYNNKNKRKKPPNRQPQERQIGSRFPTKDNVYTFQRQPYTQRNVAPPREETLQKTPYAPQQKKRIRKTNKALPMFVFIIIAMYLCAQVVRMGTQSSGISVETVAYGTLETPQKYTGLIIRDEYLQTSTRGGHAVYEVSEGEYISKNALVCAVKDTEATDALEDRLASIDKDILESQKARADLSAFSEDISRVESNIAKTVDSFYSAANSANMSYIYNMKSQVQSFMTQRNEIWLSESVESLSQLTDERSVFEQQLSQNMSRINAQTSGVVAFSYDGLEDKLTPETLGEITKAQIGASAQQYISKASAVQEGDVLFRIVKSNRWYLVVYLPNSTAAGWSKGMAQRLNLEGDDVTTSIAAEVVSADIGEKETKVVFSTYTHMEKFMNQRTVQLHLNTATAEGLKVPNDAIVEKSLIAIPRDCIIESGSSYGVLLVNGDNTKFMAVDIVTNDEENYYINQSGSLNLGDTVIKGTEEDATTYKLSDLQIRSGVYLANSSVAKFVTIEILLQNQEFSIIRSGTNYGLQAYDSIVSNAKNVAEGQSLF